MEITKKSARLDTTMEYNDLLPSSIPFKPRKPSSNRLTQEIAAFEEQKRITEELARQEDLKRFVSATQLISKNGLGDQKSADEKMEELRVHREKMQQEEQALIQAADRMRRGKNRAASQQPHLSVETEKIKIPFGNYKRDYSYIKEPEPVVTVETTPTNPRPRSGRSRGKDEQAASTHGSGQIGKTIRIISANMVLDSTRGSGSEVAGLVQKRELPSFLADGRDPSTMTEEERNIAAFLQGEVRLRERKLSKDSTSTLMDIQANLESDATPAVSVASLALPEMGHMATAAEEKGDITFTDAPGVRALVPDSQYLRNTLSARAADNGSAAQAVAENSYIINEEMACVDPQKLEQTPKDQPPPISHASSDSQVPEKDKSDASTAYSPNNSIDSTGDGGDASPSKLGGIFTQPSIVVGETPPDAQAGTGIFRPSVKPLFPGMLKRRPNASIISKHNKTASIGLFIRPSFTSSSINAAVARGAVDSIGQRLILSEGETAAAASAGEDEMNVVTLPLVRVFEESQQDILNEQSRNPSPSFTFNGNASVEPLPPNILASAQSFKPLVALVRPEPVNAANGVSRKLELAKSLDNAVEASEAEVASKSMQRATSAPSARRGEGPFAVRPRSAGTQAAVSADAAAAPTAYRNIIAENMELAGTPSPSKASANAGLTSGFRSDVGSPLEKESNKQANKVLGKTSILPLERSGSPILIVDDSCILSPPTRGSNSRGTPSGLRLSRGGSPHEAHGDWAPAAADAMAASMHNLKSTRIAKNSWATDSFMDNSGKEKPNGALSALLYADTGAVPVLGRGSAVHGHSTSVGESDLPLTPPNGQRDWEEETRSARSALGYAHGQLNDSLHGGSMDSRPSQIAYTDNSSYLYESSNPVHNVTVMRIAADATVMEQSKPPSPANAENDRRAASAAAGPFAEAHIPEVNIVQQTWVQAEEVRADTRGDIYEPVSFIPADHLAHSVFCALNGEGAGSDINTKLITYYPRSADFGPAGVKRLGNSSSFNRLTTPTPAFKAKIKTRGVDSTATAYTTLEQRRNLTELSLQLLQKNKSATHERESTSAMAVLRSQLPIQALPSVKEIVDKQVVRSFSEIHEQLDKFSSISNKDHMQNESDQLIRSHERQLRAEKKYDSKIHKLELENGQRVAEYLDLAGLSEEVLGKLNGSGKDKNRGKDEVNDKKDRAITLGIDSLKISPLKADSLMRDANIMAAYNTSADFSADYRDVVNEAQLNVRRKQDIAPTIVHLKHKLLGDGPASVGKPSGGLLLHSSERSGGNLQQKDNYAPDKFALREDSWDAFEKDIDLHTKTRRNTLSNSVSFYAGYNHGVASAGLVNIGVSNAEAVVESETEKRERGKQEDTPFVDDGLPDSEVLEAQDERAEYDKRLSRIALRHTANGAHNNDKSDEIKYHSQRESKGNKTYENANKQRPSPFQNAVDVEELIVGDAYMDAVPSHSSEFIEVPSASRSGVVAHNKAAKRASFGAGGTASGFMSTLDQETSNIVGIGMAESTVVAKSMDVDPSHLTNAVTFEPSGAIAIGAAALETSIDDSKHTLISELQQQRINSANQFNGENVEGNANSVGVNYFLRDVKVNPKTVHMTYLDRKRSENAYLSKGKGSDEFSPEEDSLFKDSAFSYSRNQTQTIHAPASHGRMLRSGVGIQHSKPGHKLGRAGLVVKQLDTGVAINLQGAAKNASAHGKPHGSSRPQSAGVTGARHNGRRDVDLTLDRSDSISKLNVHGKAPLAFNEQYDTTGTRRAGALAETLGQDPYTVNTEVNYRANTASIRDMRFQQRDKEYSAATAAIIAGNIPSQGRATQKRPQSANATAQGSHAGRAPSAAEIGLRMVNWKYGSMVRVEDSPPRKGLFVDVGGGGGGGGGGGKHTESGINNTADRSDEEFVAGALMNRQNIYSEPDSIRRDSAASANWRYASIPDDSSALNLVDSLRSGLKTTTESSERGALQTSVKRPEMIRKNVVAASMSAEAANAASATKSTMTAAALELNRGSDPSRSRSPQMHLNPQIGSPQSSSQRKMSALSISGDKPAVMSVRRYDSN